jgi:hypothetical protein
MYICIITQIVHQGLKKGLIPLHCLCLSASGMQTLVRLGD